MKSFFALVPALALAGVALPATATAQQRGTRTQRADNASQSAELRARIGRVEARIGAAERSKAINRTRAADLRRQLARMQQGMTSLSRRQGFVSAAELSSYNRTLGAIDVALDNYGVARSLADDVPNYGEQSYGDDMLTDDAQPDFRNRTFPTAEQGYGEDALASAEVKAFQRTDARLHYRDARIERDRKGCAMYQGTARDGRLRRERLLSESGRPICTQP